MRFDLADQTMPWHQRPVGVSATFCSSVPRIWNTASTPPSWKKGDDFGLLVPFWEDTARYCPSGEILTPSGEAATETVLTTRGALPFRSMTLTVSLSPVRPPPMLAATAMSPLELTSRP